MRNNAGMGRRKSRPGVRSCSYGFRHWYWLAACRSRTWVEFLRHEYTFAQVQHISGVDINSAPVRRDKEFAQLPIKRACEESSSRTIKKDETFAIGQRRWPPASAYLIAEYRHGFTAGRGNSEHWVPIAGSVNNHSSGEPSSTARIDGNIRKRNRWTAAVRIDLLSELCAKKAIERPSGDQTGTAHPPFPSAVWPLVHSSSVPKRTVFRFVRRQKQSCSHLVRRKSRSPARMRSRGRRRKRGAARDLKSQHIARAVSVHASRTMRRPEFHPGPARQTRQPLTCPKIGVSSPDVLLMRSRTERRANARDAASHRAPTASYDDRRNRALAAACVEPETLQAGS